MLTVVVCLFAYTLAAHGGVDVTRCEGAADAQALRRHAESLTTLPVPKTHFRWPHLDTLEITVTLPYVPAAFRYALTFEPLRRHAETQTFNLEHVNHCASTWQRAKGDEEESDESDFNTSEDEQEGKAAAPRTNHWSFAPNANFPRAFTDHERYAANFVASESIWHVAALDCAHVRYSTSVKLEQLAKCAGAFADVRLTNNSHALLGTLYVSGVSETSRELAYSHRYHVAIYSDAHGNAAMLVDSDQTGSDDFSIVLRSVEAAAASLNLRLQTSNDRPLRLASVTPRQSFGEGDIAVPLPMHVQLSDSYKSNAESVLQNWDADVDSEGLAYNGQYTLLFESERSTEPYLVDLFVRVDNAPAATPEQLAAAHGSITQHRPNDPESHQGVFKNGERVCMQSYVRLPGELEDHSEVELLDAALCPDDGASGTEDFACFDHAHGFVLLENGVPTRDDIEVVWPGAYGPSSVALCFTATASLVDDQGRTIVQNEQRYEARVAVHARNAAARQASVEWRAERHQSALLAPPPHLSERVQLTQAQFKLRNAAFSNGDLERSLVEARVKEQLTEHEQQVYAFVVERDETMAHGISTAEAAILIAIIVFILVCFGACWWGAVLYSRSRSTESAISLAASIHATYSRPATAKNTSK